MMRKLVLLVVLLLFGFAGTSAAETLIVGQLPIGNQPEIVADALGLYKKFGLDVTVKIFRDGPAEMSGLLSGDLQMVDSGTVPMLHLAAQNIPLYYLVSQGFNTPQTPLGAILIRPDDTAIKSFRDLKGKKVGQLAKGVNTDLWLWDATAHYGMKRDDFREIYVPFPQMGGLLASKQVDAVYTWAPFDTIITKAGKGRILTLDTPWNPYSSSGGMVVTKRWADAHPKTVETLVKVNILVNRWIDDHPAAARAIIGQRLGLPEAVSHDMRLAYFPRNGYVVMPGIWDFYRLMIKADALKPFANPKAVIRKYWIAPAERFITPVVAALGAEKDPVIDRILKIRLMDLAASPEHYYAPWEH